MRNPEKVTPNLLGNGRRILVDSAGNLREIFPTADTMFNGSTISKGKVFLFPVALVDINESSYTIKISHFR
jgi:hypothetical protein